MNKTCSWKSCGINMDFLLSHYDNGEYTISLCPNHAEYAICTANKELVTLTPHPSVLHGDNVTCDACGSHEKAGVYTTMGDNDKILSIGLCHRHHLKLITRQLEPRAHQNLMQKHGIFHEIHDDFYDEEGNALQPMDLIF